MRRLLHRLLILVLSYFKGGVWGARALGVQVGEGCRIYARSFGSEPFLIKIGNRVTVTSGVRLLTHDGSTWLVRDERGRRYHYAPITVGDDVFIGINTIVMPGVTIGSRVVIGAGSVVTRDIPSNSVAVGNPARVLGTFDDLEAKIRATCVSDDELINAATYKERIALAIRRAKDKTG